MINLHNIGLILLIVKGFLRVKERVNLEETNKIEESGKRVNYYNKPDQLISLADGVICCTNGTTQTETEAFVAKLKENGVRTE